MCYVSEVSVNNQSFSLYEEPALEVPNGADLDAIQKFIRSRVDINACDPKSGNTALINAIERDNLDGVQLLLNAGANTNLITAQKKCAIISALRHPSHPKILKCIIDSGADVNIMVSRRQTPLHFAVQYEDALEVVYMLIKAGAKVNAADLYGLTPLHTCIHYKKIAIALLENGANLHAKDDKGWKPLHGAYRCGDIELLKELVKRGASLNELSPDGCNALHYALQFNMYRPNAQSTRLNLVRFLIEEQKMDINREGATNSPEVSGLTPFMCAIGSQRQLEDDFEILDYLFRKGANINAPVFRYSHNNQYQYKTTLDWAKSIHIPRYILEWMVQHGAK